MNKNEKKVMSLRVFTEGKGNNTKTFVNLLDNIPDNIDPMIKTKTMAKILGCKGTYERQSGRAVFFGTWTQEQIQTTLNK